MAFFKKTFKTGGNPAESGKTALKRQIKAVYAEVGEKITQAKNLLNESNELLELLASGSSEISANLADLKSYENFTDSRLKTLSAGGKAAENSGVAK